MRHRTVMAFVAVLLAMPLCVQAQQYQIPITDGSSLVRVGMNPHPTDSADVDMAYTLLSALDREDRDSLLLVCDYYANKQKDEALKEKAYGALAYILRRLVDGRTEAGDGGEDLLTEDLFRFFTANRCERLKDYLVLKYELNNYRPRSVKEYISTRTFYDDMLMYNAPDREQWDNTNDVLRLLPVKKGDKIVDVGCGFGYNSWRFLQLVGKQGKVFATDTEKAYTDYLSRLMKENGVDNIEVINSTSSSLGVEETVDCIFMSSLYHVFYTWSREDERSPFLESVQKQLREGGKIVIVDNKNLHGRELNNCHVSPELIKAQLGFLGFRPVLHKSLNDKRYVLIFEKDSRYRPNKKVKAVKGVPVLNITGQKSVVHIGSLDSYDITDKGIDAASYVYDFAAGGDRSLAEIAIKKYDDIIPAENFGGEYTAMQWLCEAMLADEARREQMLSEPLVRSFYHKMTDDSCKVLRYYLLHKYKLESDSIRMLSDSLLEKSGEVGRTHRSYLEDYILALNPRREAWEHTSEIIRSLDIRPGDVVADIGCGSGFFTDKFAKMVGNSGRVYALELKDEHIQTLQAYLDRERVTNVQVIKGREDLLELPRQADVMFMCSLYHVLYGVVADDERDTYLKSLCSHLKPDGRLYVVDNGPVDDDTLPYHGPYISKELIAYQLSYYGFELEEYRQIIPQRYLLKFRRKK